MTNCCDSDIASNTISLLAKITTTNLKGVCQLSDEKINGCSLGCGAYGAHRFVEAESMNLISLNQRDDAHSTELTFGNHANIVDDGDQRTSARKAILFDAETRFRRWHENRRSHRPLTIRNKLFAVTVTL